MSESPQPNWGSALKAAVPLDAHGQFPVNRSLVAVLTIAVLYFNQLLFWLLAVLLAGRDQTETAAKFAAGSAAVAGVIWLWVLALQVRVGAKSVADYFVAGLTLAALVAGLLFKAPVGFAAGNAVWLAWSLRGLWAKTPAAKNGEGG